MRRLALVAALAACSSPDRPQEAPDESVLFRDAAAETGLVFEHFVGASGEYYLPEIMGSGAALFDYDGDGDLDAYLAQGAMLGDKPASEALFPPPSDHWPGGRLFENELIPSGKLRFRDVTESSGLPLEGYGMGVAAADYDNDGDVDLFLTALGRNTLCRNDGGSFTPVEAPGLEDPRWTTSASFVDYDRDGDLDLFFTNYVDFTIRNNKDCFDATGVRDYCTPTVYKPVPDKLFRNDGGGRFTDVSGPAGLGRAFGNGLGVTAADFNGDGWPDIYVANDGMANQLWINQTDGTFEDTSLLAGAAYNADGEAQASMGVTAGDFDEDGDEDLFMTHLAQETNTLYVNNGRGDFRDATNQWRLGAVSMPFTGFGSEWFDFDHDGRLDLFVANGGVTIVENQRGQPYPFRQRNQLFCNLGDRFEEISDRAGPTFELEEVSRGAAFGDVDNDGDVDILMSNNNGPARLLLNEAGNEEPALRVRLRGTESNRQGLGARVALLREGRPPVWRRAHSDGSYLSASEPAAHFGLAGRRGAFELGVEWPSGKRERFAAPASGSVELVEGEGRAWDVAGRE